MALSYQFDRRLGVSLELWNAFNAPRRFYQYKPGRQYQYVDIGTTVFIGINGTF
jgi:hypothetical protein